MTPQDADPAAELLGVLLEGSHLQVPDCLPELVRSTAATVAGWEVEIYVADYLQRDLVSLHPDLHPSEGARSTLSIDGTVAGRCSRATEIVPLAATEHGAWVPLLDGVERLGVLRIALPAGADPAEPGTRRQLRWFSYLVAHLLASKSSYGDAIHLARLATPRTPASELVWSLLPPLTVACERVVISGVLEPSSSVAGDVYDYAIDDELARLAIADATGHDLGSAAIGALTLAAYRASRHQRDDLPATVARIDAVLAEFGTATFATGVFGELERASGVFRYVNAGHPSPLLVRHGRVIRSLDAGRRILLGIGGHPVSVAEEPLEPGDWLVFYTDGVTEAHDEQRRFFGLDRLVDVLERSAADGQGAAESLRRVVHAVLDHQRSVLQDDATLVILQWMADERQLVAS